MKIILKRLTMFSFFPVLAVMLLSCFTLDSLDDKNEKTKYLDPAKLELSSFDFSLGENYVIPGQSYEPNIYLYNKKNKLINGTIRFEELFIQSANNSFIIDDDKIIAAENIFSSANFKYELTVSLAGNAADAVSKSFSFQPDSSAGVTVNSKNVYLELSYYILNHKRTVLIFNREEQIYYLRDANVISIIAGPKTEKIYILYPFDSDLYSKIRFYSNQERRKAWEGQKVSSPLQDTSLLFLDLTDPGFDRNLLVNTK
jgi:hypothetical protein